MTYTKKYYKANTGFDNKIQQNEGYKLLNPKNISKLEKESVYYLTSDKQHKLYSNTISVDESKFSKKEIEYMGKATLQDPDWFYGLDEVSDEEEIETFKILNDSETKKEEEKIEEEEDPMNPRVAVLTPTRNKKQFWKLMLQNLKQTQ